MENKKQKVLIVDDDQFLVSMYASKFDKSGFEVSTTTKGEDALEKLRDGFDPDILILDVVMPSLDGLALLEKIRKEKFANNAVVIMLTNQGDKPDIDHAKKLGAHGYIVKATTIPSEVVDKVTDIYKTHFKDKS